MRLADYELSSELDRKKYLDSLNMAVGLPYFGGKSKIGKFIYNIVFNMLVEMKRKGRDAELFIDVFTGGGKIGLTMPKGWVKKGIVMNDLDYGVYSYYKCVKDDYINLINMIDKLGDMMSKDMFYLSAYLRQYGACCETIPGVMFGEDEQVDELVAAAMTYWVTNASFNNVTEPKAASYKLDMGDSNEGLNIKKIVAKAHKNIPKLHRQLNSQQYYIENLDYKELIKKYNGKEYFDLKGKKHGPNPELGEMNKLYYMDPPYYAPTLHMGKDAPYANTFPEDKTDEMTKILACENSEIEKSYGTIEFFIKSDYDPKETIKKAEKEIDNVRGKKGKDALYKFYENTIKRKKELYNAFAKLEKYPFVKICVGSFDKGAITDEGVCIGHEYVWCKGFSRDSLEQMDVDIEDSLDAEE